MLITVQELGQSNQVDLCKSCCHEMPTCEGAGSDNLILGDGPGDDNTCACAYYEPIELRHPRHNGCGSI